MAIKERKYSDKKWRLVYADLWTTYGKNEFTFKDVFEKVYRGEESFKDNEIKNTLKLINTIEEHAHGFHVSAPSDRREKFYRVLEPNFVCTAKGIYRSLMPKNPKEFTITHPMKIAQAANTLAQWDYIYVKETAILKHTNRYFSTNIFHMSIDETDVDGWISLFRQWKYGIILNEDYVFDSDRDKIHLHTDLDLRQGQANGEHFQLVEHTILDCFKNSEQDLLPGLAILIIQKEHLDWDNVIDLIFKNNLINTLGFSLDAINFEAGKQVFSKKLIEKIKRKRTNLIEVLKIPQNPKLDSDYIELHKKWNVKTYNRRGIYNKAVLDLVR